jgi:hypothetical protein
MRRIRNLWFCAFAVLAVCGTTGAQTAAATEYPLTGLPEIGRCVPVAGTGLYKYKNCVTHHPSGKGNYEWLPGPGETNNKYEATLNKFKLETVAGNIVQCGGFITGEYKDSKKATVELEMKGCVNLQTKQRCQGPTPEEGEINAPAGGIEAEIGFIKSGDKPIVGWDIKPKAEQPSPNVLEFTCGTPVTETVQNWAVEGSVIGVVKRINIMSTFFKVTYKATGGKQEPEAWEAGTDTLLAKITTVPNVIGQLPSTVEEQVGLITRGETAPFEIENGEPLEIKAKFR